MLSKKCEAEKYPLFPKINWRVWFLSSDKCFILTKKAFSLLDDPVGYVFLIVNNTSQSSRKGDNYAPEVRKFENDTTYNWLFVENFERYQVKYEVI